MWLQNLTKQVKVFGNGECLLSKGTVSQAYFALIKTLHKVQSF
jgi:hypothetical protein